MARGSRDRVTVELRGMRERLQALAMTRHMTAAALLRKALVHLLDAECDVGVTSGNDAIASNERRVVKVTLRLATTHAAALARRARAADVSQGTYVASLIDGMPPDPLPTDHAHAIAALVGSTDQLAAISTDLNAFMRLLRRGGSSEIERYRAGVMSLADDVRAHLALAAPLVAALRSARRSR